MITVTICYRLLRSEISVVRLTDTDWSILQHIAIGVEGFTHHVDEGAYLNWRQHWTQIDIFASHLVVRWFSLAAVVFYAWSVSFFVFTLHGLLFTTAFPFSYAMISKTHQININPYEFGCGSPHNQMHTIGSSSLLKIVGLKIKEAVIWKQYNIFPNNQKNWWRVLSKLRSIIQIWSHFVCYLWWQNINPFLKSRLSFFLHIQFEVHRIFCKLDLRYAHPISLSVGTV